MLFSSLRRITRDGSWIPEIDGLRFLAIFSVFLFHLGTELSSRIGPAPDTLFFSPIHNGFRGVDLFFTISGFVLALPFARQYLGDGGPVALRKYYLRRLTRIEPPYLIALAGCTALYAVYSHQWPTALTHSAASAIYLHSLIFGYPSLVNGVLWSLEVEVQFYLIAPVLMQLYRLRSFRARLICYLAIASASYMAELFLRTPRLDLSLPSSLSFFVMGLLAADMYVSRRVRLGEGLNDLAGLGALAALFALSQPSFFWFGPVCTLLLCIAALHGHWLRRVLAAPWLAITGGMCYSIYLLHLKLIEICLFLTSRRIAPRWSYTENYLLQMLAAGAFVFLLSALFYRWVERPCMDPAWPSKLLRNIKGRRRIEPEAFNTSGVLE
jgi:peptidoglycan/LPS O-acetylase OafA/YrhL